LKTTQGQALSAVAEMLASRAQPPGLSGCAHRFNG
jgi:hypothetical protein